MGTVQQLRPTADDRLRPVQSERALIEIAMDGCASGAAYFVDPDDFSEPELADCLRAVRVVYESGAVPNTITVRDALIAMGRRIPDKLVVDLGNPDIIPIAGNAIRHARVIRQASKARFELSEHERAIAYYRAARFEEAADVEREMAARAIATGFARPVELAEEAYALYSGERRDGASAVVRKRVELCWLPWARTIGPMPAGSLFVIGAAPGVGKSSLILVTALSVSRGAELRRGPKVGIVSIEDPLDVWASRALAYEAGLYVDDVNKRRFGGVESEVLVALERLREMGIMLISAPGAPIDQVEQHMTSLVREHGCELVAVDYLQAIRVGRGDAMERTTEAGARVKACGARLGVPVILASQLSRPEPGNEYKEPQISRLRYSGDIEAMAEVIAMVWRTSAPPADTKAPEDLAIRMAKIKWRRPGALISLKRDPSGLIAEVDQ